MMKRIVFILLSLNSVSLYYQEDWQLIPRIERNAYSRLDGTIDNKYPISMYLELTWDYCGPNDNYKWNSRIIKGWYEYKKIGKRIPLIGSMGGDDQDYFLKLFVPVNLLDTLDGKTCTLSSYKEVFFIMTGYSMDTMLWKKSNEDNSFHVDLNETHPSTWKTNAQLAFEVGGINLLEINLSELAKNEYIDTIDVEAANEIDGNFYFIVRFGHLTTPGWFGSGQCGAGWEEWLAFIQINNSLEVEKFEYVQNESCYKLIEAEYYFDKDHPENGIAEKKY